MLWQTYVHTCEAYSPIFTLFVFSCFVCIVSDRSPVIVSDYDVWESRRCPALGKITILALLRYCKGFCNQNQIRGLNCREFYIEIRQKKMC